MLIIAAVCPAVERVMVHPVVGRVFACRCAVVKIVGDERAHPIAGVRAARIKITVADRIVMAAIDPEEASQAVEIDAVHRDKGLFIDINPIGKVTQSNFLLVITREDDPIRI